MSKKPWNTADVGGPAKVIFELIFEIYISVLFCKKYTNLHERMLPDQRTEPTATWIPGGYTSDWAAGPGCN